MRISRRELLRLGLGTGIVSLTNMGFCPILPAADNVELKIVPIPIPVGAEKPFKALHVSDSHLCFADDRDNERKRSLAEKRGSYFHKSPAFLDAAIAFAKNNNELFLHTGDLIDFVSESNLDAIRDHFANLFCFASCGNHEFSQYVGEAVEDAAYKAMSFDRVQKVYPNDIHFCSKIINGVNFVAFDDVYYNITPDQHQRFREEVARGLPIVALCHCPLYTPELFDEMINKQGSNCSYTVGVPEEQMQGYDANRLVQQKADEPTLEFLAWLKEQPLLKAILCGHLHLNWRGPFSATATQYVVGGNYKGDAYEITFS